MVNGANARRGQIDGHYSGGSDKAMEVVWIINLCPASTLERPVMAYGNEAELEFVYCDPCLLATVKPVKRRKSDTGAAAETS